MDVQPAPNVGAIASGGSTASAPSATAGNTSSVSVAQTAQTVVSAVQQSGSDQSQPQPQQQQNTTLAPAIAKLFAGVVPAPAQLNVSYRIEGNDVVTVFTDPTTHKEIAQFPPEILIGLAKFFDQQSGVTLDRTA